MRLALLVDWASRPAGWPNFLLTYLITYNHVHCNRPCCRKAEKWMAKGDDKFDSLALLSHNHGFVISTDWHGSGRCDEELLSDDNPTTQAQCVQTTPILLRVTEWCKQTVFNKRYQDPSTRRRKNETKNYPNFRFSNWNWPATEHVKEQQKKTLYYLKCSIQMFHPATGTDQQLST